MNPLQKLDCDFTICKVKDMAQIDWTGKLVFLSKTEDEISLVCETAHAPVDAIAAEPGWKGLKVSGVLDFGMVGVIADIAGKLAGAGVSIFAVSTYDTDYFFVKAERFVKSVQVLAHNGYNIE